MRHLKGKRIAVAADRQAEAISVMIEKKGGRAAVYPIQGRQYVDNIASRQDVEIFLEESFEWVVLTTGIGARTLAEAAQNAGMHEAFIAKLADTKLAVRGSKTVKWLAENDLSPDILSSDGTMKQLLETFDDKKQKGNIFLQAYDQDDALLRDVLEADGAPVYVSRPYSHEPPEFETVRGLKEEILKQTVDAVVFTSKKQVRNLFKEKPEQLVRAFNSGVQAAAVGKVTAQELLNSGIKNVTAPESQKMGAMIVALEHHYRQYHTGTE